MAYERIESQSKRKFGPTLVIKSDGKLRLSADATTQLRDAGAKRVAILWDKQKRKIALQVAPEEDRFAFKLSYSTKQRSADIGARSFLAGIGWTLGAGNADIPLEWDDAEKMFEGRLPK